MANLFILFILSVLLAICAGRSLDGLHLHPEILKTTVEIRIGNDYMDYSPYHLYLFREDADVPLVPVLPSNSILEVVEDHSDE
ncbi:hypothetical protein B5X24_HaOG212094 [Helicoverpa armigera]|uniref:Uncharacterized protein n=1 Tax=Helicoverpa armigera TaxID=29058 RepID=A0A2W1BFH9_HELAM|nr:hypothetical protein B5X24_HaOG212094 [Helicoverpa armigera]